MGQHVTMYNKVIQNKATGAERRSRGYILHRYFKVSYSLRNTLFKTGGVIVHFQH